MTTRDNPWLRRRLVLAFAALIALMALSLPTVASASSAIADVGSKPSQRPIAQKTTDTPPVDNLEDVQKAVVRIEAVGTFEDPKEGMMMAAGSGSGFIIDPQGHVVTNNHVVTGAAYFKVYLEGQDAPVNARVVGVSECADLAVIDLDGKDYPYLAWYEDPIKVGLQVYAAGFPLGDPEYTLTNGIVSKAKAAGETSWASVDRVIQHDANIDHGNSGGPLVTSDGRVVGVNYAGDMDSNQFYSIASDGALPVIEELLTGKDIDAIGINGEAVLDEQNQFSGIWVASVASGSPADDAGIQPGDILVSLEGLPLAEDGTMTTYCEILRSHDATDVLGIEVLRSATKEVLQGQLNGRQLQQSINLAEQIDTNNGGTQDTTATTTDQEQSGTSETTGDFTTISDKAGIISVDVPADWKDVSEGDWKFDGENVVGIQLNASPNLDDFFSSWGTPGLAVSYSESLPGEMTDKELLDTIDYSDACTDGGRDTLPDGELVGVYQIWKDCAEAKSSAVVSVLTPKDTHDYYVVLEIYVASDGDNNALDHIINSFRVGAPDKPATTTTDSVLFDRVDTSGLTYKYTEVSDPAIVALIPQEYSDTKGAVWQNKDGETLGNTFTAAPNIDDFNNAWTTPGMIVKSTTGMEETLDVDEMLADESLVKNCTLDKRYAATQEINGLIYDVAYDRYDKCGDTESSYIAGMAQTDPPDHFVSFDFLLVDKADEEALDVFLQTFAIDPALAAAGSDTGSQGSDSGQTGSEGPAFTSLTDDSGTISVSVPESWIDVISEDWILDTDPVGKALTAAPDAKAFNDTWDTPGIFVGVSDDVAAAFTPAEVLDAFEFKDTCTYDQRYDYKTESLEGAYDVWTECGNVTGESFVVLAATPVGEQAPMIFLYINLPTKADGDLFGKVVDTLSIAGAVKSPVATEQEQLTEAPLAIVEAATLNVRSGPGTIYNRVAVADKGAALVIQGQVNNCAWLSVKTEEGVEGWVAGGSRYVTIDARCADIPEATPPAPPPASDQGSSNSSSGGAAAGGNSGGTAAGGSGGGSANASKGCYLFQNQLGAELNITFTNSGNGQGSTFKVPGGAEVEKCFDPGKYTYTLDAPPPWGSTNGEMTVQAGDTFLFPITPQ